MNFIVRNQARIANKYIRFAKWKIRKLSGKFQKLIYSEIYVKKESSSPALYSAVIKLGVPGPDIIVKGKAHDLKELWSILSHRIKRQLRHVSQKNK